MAHRYTMQLSPSHKKEECHFQQQWMGPEIIMLSEVSQTHTKKDKYHLVSLTCQI